MSKITDIYDAITAQLSTTLTGYVRIPNPYVVEENVYLLLQKGYGVAVGPGDDTERYTGCLMSWRRDFTVVVVNQITTTENNTDSRMVLEKSILDDHDKLIKAFWNNSSLGGNAIKSSITSDSGINFIDADKRKFFGFEMILEVEYQQDPNL